VKEAVLRKLCESNVSFEAVAIYAKCRPAGHCPATIKRQWSVENRSLLPARVKWLFAAAKAPLPPEQTEVLKHARANGR